MPGIETLLFGVGAQKAGTTWITTYLRSHPEVAPGSMNEYHYFSNLYGPRPSGVEAPGAMRRLRANVGVVQRGLRQRWMRPTDVLRGYVSYQSCLMRGAAGRRAACDITPSYSTLGAPAFAAMRRRHAKTRFLFIMRDPVERLWSGLRHAASSQARQGKSFDDVMEHLMSDALDEPRFVLRSDYAATIRELESVVPREDVLYLFFERLFSVESVRRVTDHIGIEYLEPDLNVVGEGTKREIPTAFRETLQARLEPIYRFVEDRFGNEVPSSWGCAHSYPADAAQSGGQHRSWVS